MSGKPCTATVCDSWDNHYYVLSARKNRTEEGKAAFRLKRKLADYEKMKKEIGLS
jgi:hypothetical protein